jgi:hypothetical protein
MHTARSCRAINAERWRAQYRGYKIEGEPLGLTWHVSVSPTTPDLPILGHHSFLALTWVWTEAIAEARRRIDRLLKL